MAKTIVTQFGEFLNYANIVKIGVETNWDDAEIDEENGTIKPDFEMIGTDTAGNKIQDTGCINHMVPEYNS